MGFQGKYFQGVKNSLLRPLTVEQSLACFCFGFGLIFHNYYQLSNLQWDFGAYYVAALADANGGNPYDPDDLFEAGQRLGDAEYHGLLYLYPPLTIQFFKPFIYLDIFNASFIWFLLKCLALEAIAFLIIAMLRQPISILSITLTNCLILLYHPVGLDLSAGNIATFECLLIYAHLWLWQQRREITSAICLAIGAMFKFSGYLLLLHPILLRERRFLISFTAAMAVLFLMNCISFGNVNHYLNFSSSETAAFHWDEQVQSVYNNSLTSLFLRTFSETYFYDPLISLPWAPSLLIPLSALVILGLFYRIAKPASEDQLRQPEFVSLLILLALLIPPRLAGYTLVWTLFPVSVCIFKAIQSRSALMAIMATLSVCLLQTNIHISSIKHLIEITHFAQLLIDVKLFGLCLLFLSSIIIILKPSKKNTYAIQPNI